MIGATLLLAAAALPSSLLTGLVSYWKFEGNSQDAVGTNHGTDTSVSYALGNGKINQGAALNGSRIVTPLTTSLGDFSAGCWFKPSALSSTFAERLMDKDFAVGFWLGRDASVVGAVPERWGGGVRTALAPYGIYGAALNGVWNHIVTMREGTTQRLYINGALSGSATVSGVAMSGAALTFGAQTAGGAFKIQFASIDEAGLWSRAITAPEVVDWYNAGAGKTHPF